MVRSGSIASIELPWHVGFTPSGRIAATPRTVEREPIADTSKLLAACLNAHCRSTLLGCTMSDPKDQEESGRDPAASECVVLWSSLHSVPINSRGAEP